MTNVAKYQQFSIKTYPVIDYNLRQTISPLALVKFQAGIELISVEKCFFFKKKKEIHEFLAELLLISRPKMQEIKIGNEGYLKKKRSSQCFPATLTGSLITGSFQNEDGSLPFEVTSLSQLYDFESDAEN